MSTTHVKLHGYQTLIRMEQDEFTFLEPLKELWNSFLCRFMKGFPTAWGGPGRHR